MRAVVYDTGVLIAADRGERWLWAEHRLRLEGGVVPLVPSTVVAQASRSSTQAQLRLFLRGCDVTVFDEADAHQAGALLGKSRTRDIVDASVVVLAIRHRADIVTDDPGDITKLVAAARASVDVIAL